MKSKVILLTGASSGIGYDTAMMLSRQGHKVYGAARRVDKIEPLRSVGVQGVAELYSAPGWQGTVGLIRPMSRCFCGDCDRIRVTADGRLKPCLHSGGEIPLRGLRGPALEAAIRRGIKEKPPRHHLASGGSDTSRAMHEIGG